MMTLLRTAMVVGLFSFATGCRSAPDDQSLVFYLDQNYIPVTRLDRIASRTEALDAILSMYALQNGAGCQVRDDLGLKCQLTRDLGLGAQCSPEHRAIVRRWFGSGMPKMSGAAAQYYKDPQAADSLEILCYYQPNSASFQRIWVAIGLKQKGDRVIVHAQGKWRTPNGSGSFAYQTEYRIGETEIVVDSHREVKFK